MAKIKNPQIRLQAAQLMRDIRSQWPTLKGDWTRREWNDQARKSGRSYIKNMHRFMRANAKV